MSSYKEINVDKIEILESGTVQVRGIIPVMENGVEMPQLFHRWSIVPGQDYSDQPDNVKTICQTTHTPEVISAYQAKIEASRQLLGQ